MKTPEHIAIYVRYELVEHEASISSQKADLLLMLEDYGYPLNEISVYSDTISAKKPGRPGFNQMINDAKSGKFKKIFTTKLNRLARNPEDAGQIAWLIQKGLIEVITTDSIYTAESDLLMLYIHFGMANQFSLPTRRKHVSDCACCCCESNLDSY